MARKRLSRGVRFEVFRRDRFQCQYCGESAPKVVLHVDHIEPVSKGGGNEITNLLTACADCNGGKSNKRLSDETKAAKQVDAIRVLEDRREQLAMIREWKEMCDAVGDQEVDLVESVYRSEYAVRPTKAFSRHVRRLIRKYGVGIVLDAAQRACNHYDDPDDACDKLKTFVESQVADNELPGSGKIPYIVATLRNRQVSRDHAVTCRVLREFLQAGGDIQKAIHASRECQSFSQFVGMLTWEASRIGGKANG